MGNSIGGVVSLKAAEILKETCKGLVLIDCAQRAMDDKRGKYIGITSNDLLKSRRWFDKYGVSLVFWGRLVPGVRTLISVPAGMELMPLRKFLIWTSLGSLIWVTLLTYAGFVFGENYPIIETYLNQIKYIVKPILILILVYFLIKFFMRVYNKNIS